MPFAQGEYRGTGSRPGEAFDARLQAQSARRTWLCWPSDIGIVPQRVPPVAGHRRLRPRLPLRLAGAAFVNLSLPCELAQRPHNGAYLGALEAICDTSSHFPPRFSVNVVKDLKSRGNALGSIRGATGQWTKALARGDAERYLAERRSSLLPSADVEGEGRRLERSETTPRRVLGLVQA
jgi:hypothetical protein